MKPQKKASSKRKQAVSLLSIIFGACKEIYRLLKIVLITFVITLLIVTSLYLVKVATGNTSNIRFKASVEFSI